MSEWIKCLDRLPEVGIPVLYFQTWPKGTMFNCRADPLKRTDIGMGGLRYDNEWISYEDQFSGNTIKYISHWMPLPEVPKNDI